MTQNNGQMTITNKFNETISPKSQFPKNTFENIMNSNVSTGINKYSNSSTVSSTNFMTTSTKITVTVLSVLLIVSIISFLIFLLKQQFDTKVRGREYKIPSEDEKINIPRARLAPEITQKRLTFIGDFMKEF